MESTFIVALSLLEKSIESGHIYNPDECTIELLSMIGSELHAGGYWIIDRAQRINLSLKAVSMGATLETVISKMNWKDFEGFVAEVLGENNFRCIESFRRRGTSRIRGMEIDVVGVRGTTIVSVDAKMWGIRSGKSSALKTAAENQRVRTRRLGNELDRLSEKLGGLKNGPYSFIPLLVTWLVEDVEIHEGVPVIPVFKLNSFILNLHQFEDLIAGTEAYLR